MFLAKLNVAFYYMHCNALLFYFGISVLLDLLRGHGGGIARNDKGLAEANPLITLVLMIRIERTTY